MGLFENFPYTNFHRENLDWLLQEVKNLVASWAEMQTEFTTLTEAFEALKEDVDNYFDDPEVKEEIYAVVNEALIDAGVFNSPKIIRGDVSLNLYSENGPTSYTAVQGLCYIGDNKMAVYFASGSSNTGTLRIYDINAKTILSQASLELYHGNSITYYNGMLYVCGCLDVVANTYTNKIFVVDPNTLTIRQTLTPGVSMIYSLAYSDNKFYAVTAIGSAEGTANKITVFDTSFVQLQEVLLEHYPAVERGLNTQGLQCVVAGIGYVLTYEPNLIYGYNMETGALVYVSEIENVFNGYRFVDEAEGLTYDAENGDFYLSAKASNGGLYYRAYGTVAKIGVHKNIVTVNPLYDLGMAHNNLKMNAILYEERIRPVQKATQNLIAMTNFGDCVTAAKMFGKNVWINLYLSSSDQEVFLRFDNFTGVVNVAGSISKIPFRGVVATGSNVMISGGDFSKETYANIYGGGTTEQNAAILGLNSTIKLVNTVINSSVKLFIIDACDFMMSTPTIAAGVTVTAEASSCSRARVPSTISVSAAGSCVIETF